MTRHRLFALQSRRTPRRPPAALRLVTFRTRARLPGWWLETVAAR